MSFKGPRWSRYHQTKLANAAFTYGLKKKLEEANITNVIPLLAHPGLALTNLQVTTADIKINWEGCEKAVGAFTI